MQSTLEQYRHNIRAAHLRDEAEMASILLASETIDPSHVPGVASEAESLIRALRTNRHASPIEALMREYDLSSDEGLTLMELAEALLRIPDTATRDLLIRDKLGSADWAGHGGRSDSVLVNLSTMGLNFSSQLLGDGSVMARLARRMGAPVIRGAIVQVIRHLGDRFVFAETIEAALKRAERDRAAHSLQRYSFDMLGESAKTAADAERYFEAYRHAIEALASAGGDGPIDRAGISVKLSALNPRYEPQRSRAAIGELMPGLISLARQAAEAGIGFTIDAEEADRLDMSLDIIESLARDPSLSGWNGLGMAVQAYQKRAIPLIDWVTALSRETSRRMMVRLVKGAYWDSEIKRAQVEGLASYPVYTRKVLTDLSYLATARRMLDAPDAIYPMFATHNAYSVAAIHDMAGENPYEFQRLHGMGDELYHAASSWNVPCRVYAPVGPHRDLLAYLVRRLLENGANSSFVAQLADRTVPIERLVEAPGSAVRILGTVISNPRIPLPTRLYGNDREACPGLDFGDPDAVDRLKHGLTVDWVRAMPIIGGRTVEGGQHRIVASPADATQHIGEVWETSASDAALALQLAEDAFPAWAGRHVSVRARVLERAADLLIADRDRFVSLLVHEAGRTVRNAIGEWREAVDFLRFYAADAVRLMVERELPGPTGEQNIISYTGKGVFACISPWNFPLSIFLGQISAALVTGNAVLAKPAGETPLIACEAVRLLHRAGVPVDVLHYLPGGGEIGGEIVSLPGVDGVVFTGSTATARKIAIALAAKDGPIATLIAETGGQNAMIVDASALLEQVTGDIIASAFDSAGQRCSALRVLAVQDDIADRLIEMLTGAMDALRLGDPMDLETDIGPVIHDKARQALLAHLEEVREFGVELYDASRLMVPEKGNFLAPRLIEIRNISDLKHEVFGPVLHVIRWKAGQLEGVIRQINDTGYGLTLSLETRIQSHIETVKRLARVGNLYINRSQIGAVVGTQPFGGDRLSGTGPKAGGPNYLSRFVSERVTTNNTAATGGNVRLLRGE